MVIGLLLGIGFVGLGFVLLNKKRAGLVAAMKADGFAEHEVRKAVRLFDRKQHDQLLDYCRDVVERRALRTLTDWTRIESYRQ